MILLIISSVKWSRVYSHSQTVYTLVIDHFNIGLLTRRGLGGGHFQNTIRVNIKGDFNTRNTLWRGRNVFQYKRGQFVVVLEINPFLKTSYSGFCFFSFINLNLNLFLIINICSKGTCFTNRNLLYDHREREHTVLFLGMIISIFPPEVSTPKDKGTTSNKSKDVLLSILYPLKMEA